MITVNDLMSAPRSKIFEISAPPLKINNIDMQLSVLDEPSLPNHFMEIDDSDTEEVD